MKHVMNSSRLKLDNETLCEIIIKQMEGKIASNYDAGGFYKIFADKRGQTFYVLGIYNGLELNMAAYTIEQSMTGKLKPQEIGYLESYNENYLNFGYHSAPTLHISALYTTGERSIGIGSALIVSAAEFARKHTNVDYISLTSLPESAEFYKKLNFVESGEMIDDCPVMLKDVHDLDLNRPSFMYPSVEPEEFSK